MPTSSVLAFLLVLLASCGADPAPAEPDAAPPARRLAGELALGADGLSEPLAFEVPAETRSITVVVRGAPDRLHALAELRLGGLDLVGLDLSAPLGDAMREQYFTEEAGQMPGELFQSIRLGTFSHVYPHAPGQALEAGPAELRVVADEGGGAVEVEVLMPADDGASLLRVNVLAISENVVWEQEADLGFLPRVRELLGPGGVDVVVDEVVTAADTGLSRLTDFTEPQETPESQSAELALLGRDLVESDALNVFVVDSLPFGVGGLSLGTPGPPIPGSYYFGVVARHSGDDQVLAGTIAHELAHFLALQHVENRGLSGEVYPDPIDDTQSGTGNLMEGGTVLTEGQAFALSRSALLE